jgi:hypothetical protein
MKYVFATAFLAAITALSSAVSAAHAQTPTVPSISSTTTYHTATVDGLKIGDYRSERGGA